MTPNGLQKRLLDVYFDARTLEEEQGVNILYLGLGTLKWIDLNNAENVRYAPLTLLLLVLARAEGRGKIQFWGSNIPNTSVNSQIAAESRRRPVPTLQPSRYLPSGINCT